MSRLTVFADDAPGIPTLRTEDPAEMAAALKPIDVSFERWHSPVAIGADDPEAVILDAYRPYLDALMGASGAGSADVVRMTPDNPAMPAMRQKFLSEHRHTEPEMRFFVHGGGHFILHIDGHVYDVHCTAGDLIGVPAGIRHWFDAGPAPDATILRIFSDASGWVPHYTGDTISERFPRGLTPAPPEPPHMPAPRAILTDIEGTTTRIAYVRDVLFPYARDRLPALLRDHATRPDIVSILAEVTRLAPNETPLAALLRWMDQDAKITPLKTLQGILWHGGYRDGALKGEIYPDVPAALARWHAAGIRLDIYSSGSVAAQKLLFGHSAAGDLARLFSGFHDTTTGGKREEASYRAIAAVSAIPAADWLFLSDIAEELDAARAGGMATCQLVRPDDATEPCPWHRRAADFDAVEAGW